MALIYFICPPCNATENMSDVKKTMQTGILNLIAILPTSP